jgi:hypothetical protein
VILLRASAIADAYEYRSRFPSPSKRHSPGESAFRQPARACAFS